MQNVATQNRQTRVWICLIAPALKVCHGQYIIIISLRPFFCVCLG